MLANWQFFNSIFIFLFRELLQTSALMFSGSKATATSVSANQISRALSL